MFKDLPGRHSDDAAAQFLAQVALGEAFDGGLRAHGHEDGRGNVAVIGVEDAGAGAGHGAFGEEFEVDPARQSRLYCGLSPHAPENTLRRIPRAPSVISIF